MDFAKKILSKYGWKEGDGLGKNSTGIAAPLKACLKFDNAGLGVDRATEFNDHWWERCFNEAASNVTVEVEATGKVSTARKAGREAVEISTKSYSASKLKKARDEQDGGGAVYDNFLKSALLTQSGGEVANEDRIKTEDIAVTKVHVLTDEELFKACGGRTAHKGARHGLKLSGKIARLERQEKELLAKMQQKPKEDETRETVAEKKSTKQKDEQIPVESEEFELKENATLGEEQTTTKAKKKKHKKEKERTEDEILSQINVDESQAEESSIKSKKKKHKKYKPDAEDLSNEVTDEFPSSTKKRKSPPMNENEEDDTTTPVKLKKKKKKSKETTE